MGHHFYVSVVMEGWEGVSGRVAVGGGRWEVGGGEGGKADAALARFILWEVLVCLGGYQLKR